MGKDHYATLGVGKKADEKEIKSAYRKLARKYHPDVNPNDKTAEAKFKEVSEAYETLSDPEKRRMYDQFGSNWEQAQHFSGGGGQEAGGHVEFKFGGGGAGFETIFEHLFGGRGAQGDGVRFQDIESSQPRDVEKTVEFTLEEIDSGCKRSLTYQTMDAVRIRDGVSTVPTTKKVEVKIPQGIQDGKKLRVPGKGAAGANGRSGDLYVSIKWAPHERFKPVGDHLEVEALVPYTVAALGGEIRVPTLRGAVKMKIPEGTQGGQTLRLGGQGIAKMNGGRGDLLAKVKITVPRKLNDAQRQLMRQLAELEGVAT